MNKLFKSLAIIVAILFLFSPISFGAEVDFKEQIKSEEGSLFEKIIAECIGGIAQTILNFVTSDTLGVGFKDYDTLIFNDNAQNDSLSPFTQELWNKTMSWYKIFAIISGSLILIAVFILSYQVMGAGMNTAKKNEAKDTLMRLCFGGVAIAFAPLFIRFLLFLNNSLVNLLITATNGGTLDGLLGNDVLTSIRTGNAIATALVISMFIYLFVKLNIKFIIRQFTIIIFTIFTPIAVGLWIINRNVTAAAIWSGQIIMNIFMQFIYCFLFLVYIAFLPSGGGWAVSLIWAMMILPLADALQNCLQDLTSRIAGIDNEQISNRGIGMGAALGYSLGTIKEQFKAPETTQSNNYNNNTSNSNSTFSNVLSRAKSIINPSMNLSNEKDYNGNTNPIRDVQQNNTTQNNIENVNNQSTRMNIENVARTGFNATKSYLSVGAKMAEGNFNTYNRNNYNHTEYVTTTERNTINNERGVENEYEQDTEKNSV